MKTFAISVCCTLLLASLLSPHLPVAASDPGADCLADCATYGLSLFCSCEALGLDQALLKRAGGFPFRYGKRQMPFRYGKRQFRYGKRAADAARRSAGDMFGYQAGSASAYNHQSAEEE